MGQDDLSDESALAGKSFGSHFPFEIHVFDGRNQRFGGSAPLEATTDVFIFEGLYHCWDGPWTDSVDDLTFSE